MTTTESVNPYPAAPAADATGNAPGRASLVVAIVIVIVGVVQQVVVQLTPLIMSNLALGVSSVGFVFGIFAAVMGVLALIGLILGIVGLSRSYAPRLAAAAGTAIAATTLLTVLLGLLLPFILGAVL